MRLHSVVIPYYSSSGHSMRTMKTLLLLLPLFAISTASKDSNGKQCEVSIDYRKGDLKEPQPLILTDNGDEPPTFLVTNANKVLVIPRNTSILFACPGNKNSLENFGSKKYVTAVCLSGKEFLVGSDSYKFSSFKCKFLPKETIKKSHEVCLDEHQKYNIGFTIKRNFHQLYEICRDDDTYETYYANATIVKEILGFQTSYPRPMWKFGSYYPGYDMNDVYRVDSQLRSFALLLNSDELAHKYIRSKELQYLTRGHLTAKADFIYGAQQMATFWILNTAPQWSSFNSGNWMIAERNVRSYIAQQRKNFLVYTGVHGITSLEDINGVQQPLYLHVNETEMAFPVPRFFWKILHDPDNEQAVAIVGVNEPYAKEITSDMYLCPDIGGDPAFSWLKWKPNVISAGVSYVCSVEELRKSVPTVPDLGEVDILA